MGTSNFKTQKKRKNYCKIEIEKVKRCGSSMVKAFIYLFIYLLISSRKSVLLSEFFF